MAPSPQTAPALRLAGSARGDRFEVTRALADALGQVGYVTQSTPFGGSALTVFADVRPDGVATLGGLLAEAGIRLDAPSLHALAQAAAAPPPGDDVLASVVVTFSDASGDDRVEVPQVPG